MSSTEPAVLTWAMCTCEPVASASAMSRATIVSSAAAGDAAQAEASRDPAFVHDAAGGERRVLAVIDHGQAEHAGVFERAAHQVGVGDRRAVVAEGDGAGLRQFGEVRQLFARRVRG